MPHLIEGLSNIKVKAAAAVCFRSSNSLSSHKELRLNKKIRQVKYELDIYKITAYEALYLNKVNPNGSNLGQATKRALSSPISSCLTSINGKLYVHYESDGEKCEVFGGFLYEKGIITPNEIIDPPITADMLREFGNYDGGAPHDSNRNSRNHLKTNTSQEITRHRSDTQQSNIDNECKS